MQRRDLFKIGAGAAVAARAAGAHRFFTEEEFRMVDELSEMIIPADEKSGGARAAKVAEFVDFHLAEAFEQAERDRWRRGLKKIDALSATMHGAGFLGGTPEQRAGVLSRISEGKDEFFRALKDATIHAYYTSKIGIHDELDYKGNVYQRGDYAGELP